MKGVKNIYWRYNILKGLEIVFIISIVLCLLYLWLIVLLLLMLNVPLLLIGILLLIMTNIKFYKFIKKIIFNRRR